MAVIAIAIVFVGIAFLNDMEVSAAEEQMATFDKWVFRTSISNDATEIYFMSKKELPTDVASKINTLKGTDISVGADGSVQLFGIGTRYYVVSMNNVKMQPDTCKAMFSNLESLTKVEFKNFETKNVIDMSNMFIGCSSLSNVDVSSFDTCKVTSMAAMFKWCEKISSLDVSGFNTSNVIDMNDMFRACKGLTNLKLL